MFGGRRLNPAHEPFWIDVVDHVATAQQDIEATAGNLAVEALSLAVAHHLVRIPRHNDRGREQGSVTRTESLGGRDHMRGVLRQRLDL